MATNWRLAKSLQKLRIQINAAHPDRSKKSDGSIGDAAHSSRTSDHNPNSKGVVTAIDITHDPANGVDGLKLAESLRHDPRTKYLIFAGRIWKARTGKWEKYTGANRHDQHVHVSVVADAKGYDSNATWDLGSEPPPTPAPPEAPKPSEVPVHISASGQVTQQATVVVPPVATTDSGSKKSMWVTILSLPALAITWLSQNVGEAFGWLKDRELLRWVIIGAVIIVSIYLLRQIVMSATKQIGAIIFTLRSMKYHADPDSNNVSVGQPAPPPEVPEATPNV